MWLQTIEEKIMARIESTLEFCPNCNTRDKKNLRYHGKVADSALLYFVCQKCGHDWPEAKQDRHIAKQD